MPFGKRPHPATAPQYLDFDRVYVDLIKPAADLAGWLATRIDETPSLGEISQHFIERLFQADLVMADVSVPNSNVYYELGVRHGIATGGTILLALEGTELPFDIRNQRVMFYGLTRRGVAEANIAQALRTYEPTPGQNPVRRYLELVGASSSPATNPAMFSNT